MRHAQRSKQLGVNTLFNSVISKGTVTIDPSSSVVLLQGITSPFGILLITHKSSFWVPDLVYVGHYSYGDGVKLLGSSGSAANFEYGSAATGSNKIGIYYDGEFLKVNNTYGNKRQLDWVLIHASV